MDQLTNVNARRTEGPSRPARPPSVGAARRGEFEYPASGRAERQVEASEGYVPQAASAVAAKLSSR
jgi:hypothetical protein